MRLFNNAIESLGHIHFEEIIDLGILVWIINQMKDHNIDIVYESLMIIENLLNFDKINNNKKSKFRFEITKLRLNSEISEIYFSKQNSKLISKSKEILEEFFNEETTNLIN